MGLTGVAVKHNWMTRVALPTLRAVQAQLSLLKRATFPSELPAASIAVLLQLSKDARCPADNPFWSPASGVCRAAEPVLGESAAMAS